MAEFDNIPGGRRAMQDGGVIPFRQPSGVSTAVLDPEPASEEQGGQFSPRRFLGILVRRAWLILGILAMGVAGAFAWFLSQTPMYRASATLEFQRQESQVIKQGEVQPVSIADGEYMATQMALLRSRALAERVAELLDLPSDAGFANPASDRAARLTQAAGAITRGLKVATVARSRIIEVSFENADPATAARVANTTAEAFIQTTLERKYNATAYARSFLEERLASTKASLEEAERNLVAYSRDKQILDLSGTSAAGTAGTQGGSLDTTSLIALNQALTTAQAERITAEQRFTEARASGVAREALESAPLSALRAERLKLNSEYQEKSARFTPEFPAMKELAARIESIDKEIDAERARILTVLEAEYRAAQGRETLLQARVEQLKGQVQDLRTRSIDYTILAREVDTLRAQYEALLQRFKEVSIASGIGTSQISIVDRAEPPGRPFEPNLRRTLTLAIFFSLVIAIGLAMFLEYLDDSVAHPDDIKTKLGLALLGVIPKLKGKESVIGQLQDARSQVTEAFASVRTALQFATDSGAPKVIHITGVRPSEGKTSCVTGLAISFAGIGKRVLIIDADMRRPSFMADPGVSVGVSGLLTSEASLRDNVIPGAVENVFLLPAGVIPPNPAELLSSPRLSRILEDASLLFDVVLVDSPPVLGFADSPTLSAACEATVLVLQAGGVRRPTALRTLDRLQAARGHIIGAILTKYDLKKAGDNIAYGYGYGYRYYYAYGQEERGRRLSAEARARKKIRLFVSSEDGDASGDRSDT
jgi:capsular exopolysaccharide synthesis family protein